MIYVWTGVANSRWAKRNEYLGDYIPDVLQYMILFLRDLMSL